MRSRVAAVTVAAVVAGSFLASTGADTIVAFAAPGARDRSTFPAGVHASVGLTRSRATLDLTPHARHRISAIQVGSGQSLGAVSFVDTDLANPDPITVHVSQNGAALGQVDVPSGQYTWPQLLPAGDYAVTFDDGPTSEGGGTLSVHTGVDSSLVVTGLGSAGHDSQAINSYADRVGDVPDGAGIASLRNDGLPAVDVYLNGSLVASDLTDAAPRDVVEAPGTYQIALVPAGLPLSDLVETGAVVVGADTYTPTYFTNYGINTLHFAEGYQFTAGDGGLFDYGGFPFLGSTGSIHLNQPVVGGAEDTSGDGYWLVASDGGIFSFGGAQFFGSLGGSQLVAPVVGMTATIDPTTGRPGYALLDRSGHVYTYGGATYFGGGGDPGGAGAPAVGIAADPSGLGYVIAYANGDWSQFGVGIAGANSGGFGQLSQPIVGITMTPDGGGAWLVASDGGVFTLGNAPFYGSTGNIALNRPMVGIVSTWDGLGYDLIAADGGVFSYGDARFYGSTGNLALNRPVVAAVNS